MKPEQIEQVIDKIDRLQSIMIDVATRKFDIKDRENVYQELYREVNFYIEILREEGLSIGNPNKFQSLWKWYEYWTSNNLNSYASREKYIYELYSNLILILDNFLYNEFNDTSVASFTENLDFLQIKTFNKKIEQIQKIMINVVTNQSNIEDNEEIYINIYKYLNTNINNLKKIGLPIENKNNFRTIFHWKAYSLCELNTYQARREYVNSIYEIIVTSIDKALQRSSFNDASVVEFLEYFKRYLSEKQSTQASKVCSEPEHEHQSSQLLNEQKTEITLFKHDIENTQPVVNLKSIEEISLIPTFNNTTQPSQLNSFNSMIDVVIITALQKEKDAILRYLDSSQVTQISDKIFYKSAITTLNSTIVYQVMVTCLEGMGNLKSSFATQNIINQVNPSRIILVGIAGGVPKDGRYLGDLLVGEQIIYYESGKQIQSEHNTSQTRRRYEVYRPAKDLLDVAKSLNSNWVFSIKAQRPDGSSGRIIPKVHFGVVASGDKVIADSTFIEELQSDWSQLVGVEMESAGAASAAYESNFMQGIFLVKGMCDWADGSKNDTWQEYAAESAACFVVNLLKSAPFQSKSKSNILNSQTCFDNNAMQESFNHKEYQASKMTSKIYSGQIKSEICKRLVRDWEDLADYFDIELYQREQFEKGKQAHRIWEWLQQRNKLSELENALIAIGREDLVQELYK